MNRPVAIKLSKGYAIISETGLYFTKTEEDLEKYLEHVEKRKPSPIPPSNGKKEKLAKVIVYLSTNCNLRCVYCYARSGEKASVVSRQNAKALITYIANRVDKFILDFHGGGEPLLYFDLIKELRDYAKETGKLYRTVLISNGVIAPDNRKKEIWDWIVSSVDVMGISCDGMPVLQNKNRPKIDGTGSSEAVEETIRFFNSKDYVYTVRSTITGESVHYLKDMVEYFYNIGVKNVIFSPCYNYGRTTDSRIVPNPANYVQNYMEAIQFAYKHGMRLSSNSFRYPGKHYCGALAGFNIALTTDNYISTCYEVVDKKSDPTGNFIVGEMNNGEINFYLNKIGNLKAVEEEDYNKKCRACSYHLLCRGGCPVKLARNSVDSLNNLCAITKSLAPKMLEFLREHPDAVHTVFKNVSLSNINIE